MLGSQVVIKKRASKHKIELNIILEVISFGPTLTIINIKQMLILNRFIILFFIFVSISFFYFGV
jgi:hypothetical protein